MQTSKKKPSAVFIVTGALLAAYLGYLIGGAWSDGQNLMIFMESFNQVCQKPFANYFNDNTHSVYNRHRYHPCRHYSNRTSTPYIRCGSSISSYAAMALII